MISQNALFYFKKNDQNIHRQRKTGVNLDKMTMWKIRGNLDGNDSILLKNMAKQRK